MIIYIIIFYILRQIKTFKILKIIFFKHVFFFIHQKKDGKRKLGIIFGGFWCGMMNIHNNKLVHDVLKTKENHTF